MDHRKGQWIFAIAVGLAVALGAYRWASNPAPRIERELQESVVLAAREHLSRTLEIADVDIVDPLAPDRKVGKGYVYRSGNGWEVSGFYRRGEGDRWHPYLMSLDDAQALAHLKVEDTALLDLGRVKPELDVLPGATRKR